MVKAIMRDNVPMMSVSTPVRTEKRNEPIKHSH